MTAETYIFDSIPFAADIAVLDADPMFGGSSEDPAVAALWETAVQAARPKAIVACVDVLHNGDRVSEVGGQPVNSIVLDNSLGGLHRAFAYVATCGTELNDWNPGGNGDAKDALRTLRMLALRAALEYASRQIRERFQITKLAAVNPGSLPEWPLSEQKKLFAMLGDVQGMTGVTLGTSMFMSPVESSSGLWFETEREYQNCMVCTRLDCIGRRAPYDEKLAKRYR